MATFLKLTNKILSRLNEVPLTTVDFQGAVGFHNDAKNAVNAALKDINAKHYEWPFNHAYAEVSLEKGEQVYPAPTGTKSIDWHTFYIARDDDLNINPQALHYLDYEDWANNYRTRDYALREEQYNKPKFVFRPQGSGFGVSGVPDKAYKVKFEYWKLPTELHNYNDEMTVPDSFEFVVVDGAMYYAYLFRDNFEGAGLMSKKFEDGIEDMRRILIPMPSSMKDRRIKPF